MNIHSGTVKKIKIFLMVLLSVFITVSAFIKPGQVYGEGLWAGRRNYPPEGAELKPGLVYYDSSLGMLKKYNVAEEAWTALPGTCRYTELVVVSMAGKGGFSQEKHGVETIQAAIASLLLASEANRCAVIILPGQYHTGSETVVLPGFVDLIGTGRDQCIIKSEAASAILANGNSMLMSLAVEGAGTKGKGVVTVSKNTGMAIYDCNIAGAGNALVCGKKSRVYLEASVLSSPEKGLSCKGASVSLSDTVPGAVYLSGAVLNILAGNTALDISGRNSTVIVPRDTALPEIPGMTVKPAGDELPAEAIMHYDCRQATEGIESISPEEVYRKLRKGGNFVLIDVRDLEDYDTKHIKGAISIPQRKLRERFREIPRFGEIVLYCSGHHCNSSHVSAKLLKFLGLYDVKDMEEGFEGWEEKGYPVAHPRKSKKNPIQRERYGR